MKAISLGYRRVHAGLTVTAIAIPVRSKALAVELQTARFPTVARDGGPLDDIPHFHSLVAGDHARERRRLRSGLSARLLSRRSALRPDSPGLASSRLGVAESQQRAGHGGVCFIGGIGL